MSVALIELLLHYYYSPVDWWIGRGQHTTPWTTLDYLVEHGYLRIRDKDKLGFVATEKLNCYVRALCAVPEPVWTVPDADAWAVGKSWSGPWKPDNSENIDRG